jgi:hypothetical protein
MVQRIGELQSLIRGSPGRTRPTFVVRRDGLALPLSGEPTNFRCARLLFGYFDWRQWIPGHGRDPGS